MAQHNAFYAQSGGVTAVINASACGVIEACRQAPDQIGKVYAGHNGIIGALTEDLIDVTQESDDAIAALRYTPGGAFGSCRYKLKDIDTHRTQYERLIEVFKAHDIRYFFYNGGGDSADTCLKVSQLSEKLGYPLTAIHVPKTVDNDLPITDNSPGFGSVAKYIATSTREASLDIASMCATSTKVFVLEVMGRHAGWIAAAGGLAGEGPGEPPHLIIFPEIPFNRKAVMNRVEQSVQQNGYCVIVVSEGARYEDDTFLADAGNTDAFGHRQLGGVAPTLAGMIKQDLGYKYHWAVADYLQRAARHLASKTDVEQAYAVGREAVTLALAGKNAMMPAIRRISQSPYQWDVISAPLSQVANQEKFMPRDFISEEGFDITDACRDYLSPLIQGEDFPPFENGLPKVAKLKLAKVERKLPVFTL
ncbi:MULTISPECIES: 6-phosphofructokinase [unclassified Halomonas]|uniref:6-phosphofructokinase n=1 Tax=unclassified Halomonas TaxID=2609666 RepID=UPI0006DA2636|nr:MULTISPECIES: 6-phosphofructokinase [unclassified Halomonas]KPQ26987.1 MAG: 6-phosphofructokinase 1 PfkA [Halomonas sp. HL-93]SBR49053.1 pyrophosphate-dependent phosphofructokinase [Halomonas sp. HL-93]SNY95975.1 pyrophosphate-dependent phosphofructokinase [Halomonas sp. hl-4]